MLDIGQDVLYDHRTFMQELAYFCPNCQKELVRGSTPEVAATCSVCKKSWTSKDGLMMFSDDKYWGEIPEAEMRVLVEDVRANGFESAIKRFRDKDPERFQFIFDHSRADWRFGIDLKPTDRVLDVGCGLGAHTFALCDEVAQVVSFDLSYLRAKFVQQRAAFEHKDNIQTFVGDFINVPLPENSFDVIVWNGILEWIGQDKKFDDPYDVQVWALQKCFRLLRPGGRLYIGIENRIALTYWVGGRDHIGLSFTSVMPRWMARLYCRLRIKKDYRTYTHSKGGYERLLKKAGFPSVRVMMPYPGYNEPRLLIPFDDTACLKFAIQNLMGGATWKRRLLKHVALLPFVLSVYRHFFYSYDLFATKPESV